jgi:tetratricopeptide (TPR) repeat protein
LVVDLGGDGQLAVSSWPEAGFAEEVSQTPLAWPLDADALEDLRWYLEDYLLAPYGVWEGRGPAIGDKLVDWGKQVFGSVFADGPARFAYERARDQGLEVVFRSDDPGLLALPWELMRDGDGPVALGAGGISRTLKVADRAGTLEVPGGKLRVLMVISRPGGTADVSYQMVARPLLERLDAVQGEVSLTVLRPPTFDALRAVVQQAGDAGEPFHVVHFDGHGAMLGRSGGSGGPPGSRPNMMTGQGEGVLAFEKPGGGSDLVGAAKVAQVLVDGKVPVVVLNACQSGAVGKELEASVATALLHAGCAAVVAMAYSVYALAAAEFMEAFYESLFTGASVGLAVTAGRKRLFEHDDRPSPKGDMPLADWLVPVHYLRREVRFPQARTARPSEKLSLDEALDQIRTAPSEAAITRDALAAVDGVFVGRDDLFYQMEIAARLQRVVVLTGSGGTGKTELAKGFARWWRDTGGVDDPRLVFWHSFEPGVATFGLEGVINAIGLEVFGTDFARLDPPQQLEEVKQVLSQYRALLVWDNFESVAEMPDPAGATPQLDETGCTALKGFLDWTRNHSHSAVLITTRAQETWLGQVRRIRMGGLNRAEAAGYADHLLAPYPAAQQRRKRRSFGDLLEWLEGHPLAMRLTLPRLDATDPADLLAGLRGTIPLSAEDDADPDRLSSLGTCITYSFAHLTGQTRRLLPALSLLHGIADANLLVGFSVGETVAARFAEISGQEWQAVLRDAARVGLLTDLGGLFQIHPALPGYLAAGWRAEDPDGYQQEREACEQALRAASASYCRWLMGLLSSDNAALALALIELNRRTLGAMLAHALAHHAWADAERIVSALDEYWDNQNFGEEAAAWADRILATAAEPGEDLLTPAASLWLYTTMRQADRQRDTGEPEKAARGYQQALAYLQGQPATEWTRRKLATIYQRLGENARAIGRLDEADSWLRRSLAIEEEDGNRAGMLTNYIQLGKSAYDRGRLDEAEEWHRKSLAISEQADYRPNQAGAYHHLGVSAQNLGRLHEAEEWYRKSLAISEELGDRPLMAGTYHQLGVLAYISGRLDEAEEWHRKSLAIEEKDGNLLGRALSYHELGMIAQARGRLGEAEEWYRKSIAINEKLGGSVETAIIYGSLGLLAIYQGQDPLALVWNIQCVTRLSEFPSQLSETGPGPAALGRIAWLTGKLGMTALEEAWQQVTGQSLPQQIRDYVTTSEHYDESSQL